MKLPAEDSMTLIAGAKEGNEYALAQLLQQNYGVVYRFLLKLTLDSQLAADITQDCMVRVIDKFALYDPQKSALSTWMIAIAKNLWLEECRNTRRRLSRLEQYNEPGAYDPVDRLLDGDEVLLAVKRLSDKMRAPILLKYAHGYSYEEISRILRIPLGTVKSRISNGMQNLKKELENDGKR